MLKIFYVTDIHGSEICWRKFLNAGPFYGAEVTKDGEAVGTLTSPANSPQFGVIGIAILDAAAAGEGERVDVALGDATVPATVDANAAIYDPEKRRPRS